MTLEFSVETHEVNGTTVVTAAGELGIGTADRLILAAERAMHRPECHTLHLDLSGITFCDSAGLGALVSIRNGCQSLGMALVLDKPSERVTRLMQITGLDQVFPIASSG
jgi:anti-sigma B factor antagonist